MNSEEPKPEAEAETVPEPESITQIRKILGDIARDVDAGKVAQISCYAQNADGEYTTYVSQTNGRHEDAGRILELALVRLGFVQREDVDRIVGEL